MRTDNIYSPDGVFKGSEYRFPPPLLLATGDSVGGLHHGDEDEIPLADLGGERHADMETDAASDTGRGEQHPAENI